MSVPPWLPRQASAEAGPRQPSFDEAKRARRRQGARLALVRLLIVANLLLGLNYLFWRYTDSIAWAFWPLALLLLAAETYSFIDAGLFGVTMWRWRRRIAPPLPRGDETVDVLVTCYNEPVELVRQTVRAAVAIRHPHHTWVLDDGESPAMRRMAYDEGAGYIVRSGEWQGRERHAKAGNLNNALFRTNGEFILIQDADQIPMPNILDQTLGYFRDPTVAFVQTPQWFRNVPPGDPFGSQAPLFYGPLQEGKDGWNAAFFCGSNAVLRREALFQAGLVNAARDHGLHLLRLLGRAGHELRAAESAVRGPAHSTERNVIRDLRRAAVRARRAADRGAPEAAIAGRLETDLRDTVWRAMAEMESLPDASHRAPRIDRSAFRADLRALVGDEVALRALGERRGSPVATLAAARLALLPAGAAHAMAVMPIATISVTEDMATAMRIHALGWKSVYHPTVLATGLAPEDLGAALQQRLRWAQGTIQVFLRENPLLLPGLRPGQRLSYLATMWSYLSGFPTLVYLAAPALYLACGWTPIDAWSADFFWRLVPYLVVNQLLFLAVRWGLPTWRGQQYGVALFPVWIRAFFSAVRYVWAGKELSFLVTPKTRGRRQTARLIWPQIGAILVLVAASIAGVVRLGLGLTDDAVPVTVNVLWALYDIAVLAVLLDALTYRPARAAKKAAARERVAAGRAVTERIAPTAVAASAPARAR